MSFLGEVDVGVVVPVVDRWVVVVHGLVPVVVLPSHLSTKKSTKRKETKILFLLIVICYWYIRPLANFTPTVYKVATHPCQ